MSTVIFKLFGVLICTSLLVQCSPGKKETRDEGTVKFFVNPATNSDDMEVRMAYGLNIIPPWPDGGSLFVNLPEHFAYMPATKGIARHHDMRKNVWQVFADSTQAGYSVESTTEPNVFFSAKALSTGKRVNLEFTVTNRTQNTFPSLVPLFCFQYTNLNGFPKRLTNNFAHTYIIINGKPALVESLQVQDTAAVARGAQVKDCKDEHNWFTIKMGGQIAQPVDRAVTILTASDDDRKVVLQWTPGKSFLSNSYIPCIHADPNFGDLLPLQSITVKGELLFTRAPLNEILNEISSLDDGDQIARHQLTDKNMLNE